MTSGPWEQFQSPLSTPVSSQTEAGPWDQFQVPPSQGPGPRAGSGLADAFAAGWQSSATGLSVRGRLPDVVLDPQHSKWYERAVSAVTQMGADAPEEYAGAVGGAAAGGVAGSAIPVVGTVVGAAVGAGAGFMAVPTAIRTALMERYKNGEAHSTADFLSRTNIVMGATSKSAVVGGLTAGAGMAAKPMGALVAGATELGTMTTAGAALEGRLPEPQEFLDAAVIIGGMHVATGVMAGRMREVYAKTGVTPEQVIADAKADPTIAEDLAKPAAEAPDAKIIKEMEALPPIEGEAPAPNLVQWDPSAWPEANPDIPRAYQPAACAQAVADALPGTAPQAQTLLENPWRDDPGTRIPFQLNLAPIDGPNEVIGLIQAMNEQVENGAAPRKSHEETAVQGARLADMLGTDGDGLAKLMAPFSGLDNHMEVVGNLMMKAQVEAAAAVKAFKDAGVDATETMKTDALLALQKAAMISGTLRNNRTEIARALNAMKMVKDVQDKGAAYTSLMDQFGKGGSVDDLLSKASELDSPEGMARFTKKMNEAPTWQQVMEAWKAGLLGPTTVVKKGLSDVAMMVSRPLVDLVAYGLGTLPGTEQHMTAMEPIARVASNFLAAKEGLIQGWATLKHDFASPIPGTVAENNAPAIPGLAGQIIRTPFSALKAITVMFETMEQRGEAGSMAARQAASEGLNPMSREYWERIGDLSTNPPEAHLDQIEKFGQRMTFGAELGEKGKLIQKIAGAKIGDTGVAPGQLVLPFTKIPINVMKESMRLSPFAWTIGEWRADFAEGGIARNKALAEMAVGTTIGGLALAFAAAGKISGSGDPDPAKRRVQLASGWQPNSVNLGGKWYSVGMIHPVGSLLAMAADVHEMSDRMEAGEQDQAVKVLQNAFAHAVTQQSFLQGMTNVVHALDAPEKSGSAFLQQLAASVVPATITQTAALIHGDPYKRQVDSIRDAVQARIPGLREQMLPQRDPWGAPTPNDDRVIGVSPIVAKAQSSDPVRAETLRLEQAGFGVGAQAVPHSIQMPAAGQHDLGKVDLTPQQRDVFGDVAGHMAHNVMSQIIASPGWEATPDMIKQQTFQHVLAKANELGKATAISPTQRQAEMQSIVEGLSQRLGVVK